MLCTNRLKTGKLTHQDIGQMDFYVRLFEDQIKQPEDYAADNMVMTVVSPHIVASYSFILALGLTAIYGKMIDYYTQIQSPSPNCC
jgi:hypothetical protein